MIVNVGSRRFSGGLFSSFRKILTSISDGAFYNPSSISSLNQLSTGTTPVTAVTQPVGLVLDSRLGLALGPELVTNGTFDTDTTGWTPSGAVLSIDANRLKMVSNTGGNGQAYQVLTTVVGKTYQARCSITASVNTNNLAIGQGIGQSQNFELGWSTASREVVCVFVATVTTTYLTAYTGPTDGVSFFDNISVKLLEGNHALQSTAASRPTWEVDAGGYNYLKFLGTDDSIASATGGGGSTGFFWCGVVEPTGGAGTDRVIFDDRGTLTGYAVTLSVGNKLAFGAHNGAAGTWLESTATLTAKSLATVWDDGTNLNVQINSVAAETVGRPVVVAGTAGFTIGKGNGVASSFFIGNLYPSVYVRGSGLTAIQRAQIQAYLRSAGGL